MLKFNVCCLRKQMKVCDQMWDNDSFPWPNLKLALIDPKVWCILKASLIIILSAHSLETKNVLVQNSIDGSPIQLEETSL